MPQVEIKNVSENIIMCSNENNPEGVDVPPGETVTLEVDPLIGVEISAYSVPEKPIATPLADDEDDAA